MLKGKSFLFLFLIAVSILGSCATKVKGQEEPKVYVDPPIVNALPGKTFTLNVKVADVKNLYTYQFYLRWDPNLLDATDVAEEPFLNAEGTYRTSFNFRIQNTPDYLGDSGYVYVACTLLGEPATAAASGSGTLTTLTFLVKEEGNTSLHLYDTKLINSLIVEMSHDTDDSYFQTLPPPEVHVKPSSVVDASLLPGSTFSINISVIQAAEVYAWNLSLSWDAALLNVSSVEEGSFLNQGAYNTAFNKQIHQEEGFLYANCSLFEEPQYVAASGNGTLLTVNFLVETVGSTVLGLHDTKLLDYGGSEASHKTQDGYFENAGVHRDVSIVSVEASKSVVEAGDSVSVTVIAKNEGDVTEYFDVTVYWDGSNFGTLSTSDLNPGAEKTLTFSWRIEDVAEGNYTIKAVASSVTWETDIDDNTYVDGRVTVMLSDQPFPFTQILIVSTIIILGIAITGAILLKRKR